MTAGLHINLDDAWDPLRLPVRTLDARPLGPHLRYTAPESKIQRAISVVLEGLGDERFLLYGSGDFHYLAAWWLRRALQLKSAQDITLISFDNHPDWDIRPPRWACGGWINRALEMPQIHRAVVWGCGNFELAFPARLFRNRRALASGKLQIHAWAQRQFPRTARLFDCMTAESWRDRFATFARTLAGRLLYVTIDLDSLAAPFAATNWENGLFTPDDLVWALEQLRAHATIFAGDCCGAFSPVHYARAGQRFAGNFDHPKIHHRLSDAQAINHRTLDILWPTFARL